jgi:hypothetical protein
MKLVSIVLLASVASTLAAAAAERGLQILAKKWNITDPSFTYGALGFELDYQVSDFIDDDMTAYALYTSPGCKETGAAVPPSILTSTKPVLTGQVYDTDNHGDGVRDQKLTVGVVADTITASDIYAADTTLGAVIATIDFCVRFSLQTNHDGTHYEVNFLETLVTLFVDLSDSFVIADINIASKNKLLNTANQGYLLEGYQCNGDNEALVTEADLTLTRNQGSVIRVCVKPDIYAFTAGIKMRSIDYFTFSRNAIIQSAIIGYNQEAVNGLTSLTCNNGDAVCFFETILFAAFYNTTGVVVGSGTGSMQFGGARGLRGLQADTSRLEAAATSEFDLYFGVLYPKFVLEVVHPYNDAGSATIAVMSAIALVIAGAFLFYLIRWSMILIE